MENKVFQELEKYKKLGGIKMNENYVGEGLTKTKAGSEVEGALERLSNLVGMNSEKISRIHCSLINPRPMNTGVGRPEEEVTLAYVINSIANMLENDSEVLNEIESTINRQLGGLKLE